LNPTWFFKPVGTDGKPWLHIDRRKSGVTMPPAVSVLAGSGRGRELIEQALPYQVQARTSYQLGADGIHCTMPLLVSESMSAEARFLA
jgi:hypothetical protein